MKMEMDKTGNTIRLYHRAIPIVALMAVICVSSVYLRADTGNCGGQSITLPFSDVPSTNIFFCSIAEAFFSGLTNGASATTYSPNEFVPREQMAAFVTRAQDSALRRGSRRAALGQWWTPRDAVVLRRTSVGSTPRYICFDGEDIWVPNLGTDTVTRVHASDGRVLNTWTGVIDANHTIAAAGYIYVIGLGESALYRIDPAQPPGTATAVANDLGANPSGITFDGLNLWTANNGSVPGAGSISRYNIVTDTTTTFTAGFNDPVGIAFDGTHLWIVDKGASLLHRVDPANGAILESVSLGPISSSSVIPSFDGSNLWVPINDAIKVINPSQPARLLATLTGNGLGIFNDAAAFDGERVMVTSIGNDTLSLWNAASLRPLGFLSTGDSASNPKGVCSDGLHFWVTLTNLNQLARF